jgi:hypothetical protein
MSKKRYVDTRFWDDEYIIRLDPMEKLLFLYFLTNTLANLCGIYEISIGRIAFDTEIDIKKVKKTLAKFGKDKKVYYIDGYVFIKNYEKYQLDNPKIKAGREREKMALPDTILSKINSISIVYQSAIDSQSHFNSNFNSNFNYNFNLAGGAPAQVASDFLNIPEKQEEFISKLSEKGIGETIARQEVKKFVNYWTELNGTGKKQRWQMEKTFEVQKRLASWFGKIGGFNKPARQEKKTGCSRA